MDPLTLTALSLSKPLPDLAPDRNFAPFLGPAEACSTKAKTTRAERRMSAILMADAFWWKVLTISNQDGSTYR